MYAPWNDNKRPDFFEPIRKRSDHIHRDIRPAHFHRFKPEFLKEDPLTLDNFFKIVIVLDESGSMDIVKNKMIDSINDLIAEQKQVEGKQTTLTLVKFNGQVNRVIKNKHISEIRPIASHEYIPNGSTSLYDAIGDTINWFRNEKDVLMVIVTDGQENSSKNYNKKQINRMIEEKKESGWSYVYLSNDLSTETQGNDIGLQKSSLSSNCRVTQENYGDFISNNLNKAIKNYRSYGMNVQSQLNSVF
jgi:Mg-chelatase subunit ChlD